MVTVSTLAKGKESNPSVVVPPSLVLLNTKPGSLNTPRLFEDHQPVGGTETEVDGV
jgi:hypothetical protein